MSHLLFGERIAQITASQAGLSFNLHERFAAKQELGLHAETEAVKLLLLIGSRREL